MIPVVWLSRHDGISRRGTWDQGTLDELLTGKLWPVGYRFDHRISPDGLDGAVVVLAGQHHKGDVEWLNEIIWGLGWCVLVLTGDEEGLFPLEDLHRPSYLRLWTQPPREGRGMGYYLPPDTSTLLRNMEPEKSITWFYGGQVNGEARKQAADAMTQDGRGLFMPTEGFGQGAPRMHYLRSMARAKIAPSPSAWKTPDTFRTYEALEAGAVPILDSAFYEKVLGPHPLPVLSSWKNFSPAVDDILEDWPNASNRCSAFWQAHKRSLALNLRDDLEELTGQAPDIGLVTVIMPTSPIPSHPSTEIISQTLASIRRYLALRDCEILICIDGIRPEQEHRRGDYEEYVRRIVWACEHEWTATLPIVFDSHKHQSGMTRAALAQVRTPTILFVEHDTPLVGEIEWEGIFAAVTSGQADLVRLHHEASILEPHRYLMVDDTPQEVCGVPMLRTSQWSQRPHVASTEYYRRVIAEHFTREERWMIEDKMHSVASSAFKDEGEPGWERHKLWMYAPPGDMKRSEHLDGRQGDPKWVDK